VIEFIEAHEPALRFTAFAVMFALIAVIEFLTPARERIYHRYQRWFGNIGLNVISNLLIRFAMPLVAVEVAVLANQSSFGLFNALSLPFVVEVLLCLILLDLVIYTQHVVFHRVPLLWRLHQVHHTDKDFDTTTALRFHPIEILVSMVIKMAAVALLGASAVAVILFEILLNAMALFNHGNFHVHQRVEYWLRALVVTPDMHRVHHSDLSEEHNRNFGFNLSCWDRLFKPYQRDPKAGHRAMTIGLSAHQNPETRGLWFMLALPFRKVADKSTS
jgi:sterol desaturase/sphingolipid hydroxylase (fatty acid hydroxylase superfamily)